MQPEALPPARAAAAELGVAARTHSGEVVSGDLHFLQHFPHGLLLGLIDGLGHGQHAYAAAHTAAAACAANPAAPLEHVLRACHFACLSTRGVVLTLVRLDLAIGQLDWVGVGNVDAFLIRGQTQRKSLRLWAGLVGQRLPEVRVESLPVAAGDLIVMATDGIKSGFAEDIRASDSVGRIASLTMATYFRDTDDATVVALRVPAAVP